MIFEDIEKFKEKIGREGVIMALDIGTKKIGIATSDFHQMIATPQLLIHQKTLEEFFLSIQEQIAQFQPKALVIGLPINIDDSESEMSQYVRKFTKNLDQFLMNFDILLLDERFSTFEASLIIKENKKTKKQRKLIDKISAAVILRGFINTNSHLLPLS